MSIKYCIDERLVANFKYLTILIPKWKNNQLKYYFTKVKKVIIWDEPKSLKGGIIYNHIFWQLTLYFRKFKKK
jgi:hypothetical protein